MKRLNKEWHQSSPPKHQKIPHSVFCGKNDDDDDDDVIVGISKPTRSATHVQRDHRTIITSVLYGDLLWINPRSAIRSKYHGLLCITVLLQHCAMPLTAHMTSAMIEGIRKSVSLILHTCLIMILGRMKEVHSRKTFPSDEEVQEVVHRWIHMQPENLFHKESRH
jgi:hypothetical protein